MSSTLLTSQQLEDRSFDSSVQQTVNGMIDSLVNSLPEPKQLTAAERRGIIAGYTAVLEGNFIYWMTATLLPFSQRMRALSSWRTCTRKCVMPIRP